MRLPKKGHLKGIKTSSLKFLKNAFLPFFLDNSVSFSHPFFPVLGMTSDGDNVTEVIKTPDLSKCGVNYCPAVPVDNSG